MVEKKTEDELPKCTPPEIIQWVKSVEAYYPVNALSELAYDATLKQVEEAFATDRHALIGIGEELATSAKWNAWASYQSRLQYEES